MHENAVVPMSTLIWPMINFAILVAGIVYFTKKQFLDFVALRHTSMRDELQRVRGQLASAEKDFADYQGRLSNLDREVRELYIQSKADMESTKLTLMAQARKMSETIVTDAQASSESLVQEFKTQIKADLTRQVMAKAESLVRARLTGEDRDRIRRDFSKQVEVKQ